MEDKKKVVDVKANIVGAGVTFLIGILVSLASYVFLRYVIKKHPEKYAVCHLFKQMLQLLFFVAVFFVGRNTESDVVWLLVGAVLGVTIMMPVFTYKLVKNNDSHRKEESADG